MKKMIKRIASLAAVVAVSAAMLVGCGGSSSTAGKGEPAITLDGVSVSMDEANFYTYIMKSQYESYYGTEIWDMELEEGKTFGDSMKEMVNDALVQMLILNSNAEEYGVSLSSEDNTSISEYIDNFKANVGEEEMAAQGITEAVIKSVLEKSYIASYTYDAMMTQEEVELSDEEKAGAACVRVQHILISTTETMTQDADGNNVDMTAEEAEEYKEKQKLLAENVLAKAKAGEDFQELANEYTAANAGFEFAFNKNGFDPVNYSYMVEPFYKASWELGEGELSDLVESEYGYHIIKCVSLNDETATQAAIALAENDLKYASLDEKLLQMTAEAEYTVSEGWEAYTIKSDVTAETGAETAAETQETVKETAAETVEETETSEE